MPGDDDGETTMDLILWRHAEAEDGDGKADAKRRLTARGEKQARKMAAWLRSRLKERVPLVLVSPTERTQQTAHALGLPFEIEAKIGPGADVAELLAAAGWIEPYKTAKLRGGAPSQTSFGTAPAGRPAPYGLVSRGDTPARPVCIIVGHQPTLGRLAALLLSGEEADWSVKKGAVWWFSRRMREGEDQVVLRAMVTPDML